MLFKNISALVSKGVVLTFTVTPADKGMLEVNVLPSSATGKSGMALIGKSFLATPEELDEEFAGVMAGFSQANMSLKEQLDAVQAQADQALEDSKASAKAAKSAKPLASKTVVHSGKADPTLSLIDGNDEENLGSGEEVSSKVVAPKSTAPEPVPFTL